jgi:hypothetical protein
MTALPFPSAGVYAPNRRFSLPAQDGIIIIAIPLVTITARPSPQCPYRQQSQATSEAKSCIFFCSFVVAGKKASTFKG